jgi:TP901 family phage tail tape measure protein
MADVNANIGVGINTSEALSQLKSLQRQISQFHSSIIKSSEAAAVAQRNLQKNFINSVNSIGAFSAELRTVRTSAESFTNSLEKNKFSMREYFRYSAASTKTFGKNFAAEFNTIEKVAVERVKTLQTQYIKMGRDAQGAMQAIAVRPAVLNMQDLGTQTAIAAQKQVLFNQLVKQGSTNLLNFGKNTQWAGRQLMVGFTLPLITLGAAAAKTFMEMEAQVIKFKKVYGDLFTPDQERAKALEEVQALAKAFTQYGIAASDTVGVAAEAAAAGFSGVDLQNQTEQSLRLSVLGQIDYQKSLATTISLQNSFRLSSADLAESIDFLNAVENQTVVSLDDITTAIPKVAPVIQSLGGDVKDLAFFMAAMKEGGINASEGANALKSGLASLINPSEKSAAFLASLGINLKGIVDTNPNDVKGVVIGFAQALDKLEPTKRAQAIEQLFGKFQFARLSTLFDNVIRDGTQASRVLDLAGASIDELANMSEKELGVTAESAMNRFLKTVEDLKIALAPIGEVFLQVVTPFVEMIADIAEGFNRLPEGIQKGIAATVAIVGGLGPVVLMTFGLLANGIANAIKFVAMLRNGYLGLTGQTDLLSEQTQYMTMEQLEAAAAAASLDQSHSKLIQTFNVEAGAVSKLTQAYQQAMAAGSKFAAMNPNLMASGAKPAAKFANGGVVGGSGNKDTVAAMLTPGEFVVKKDVAQRMLPFLEALNGGKLPGFNQGGSVPGGKSGASDGMVRIFGEFAMRLQDASENMAKLASSNTDFEKILAPLSMRVGEARGITPSQSKVQAGAFDEIGVEYEGIVQEFTNNLNSEFDTTFKNVKNADDRFEKAWLSAGQKVEQEVAKISSDVDKGVVRKVFGLDPDFMGTIPTMPRREGGTKLERARKSAFNFRETGVRSYNTEAVRGGARAMLERRTGESAETMQMGHAVAEKVFVPMQDILNDPRVTNAAKKAGEVLGIGIAKNTTDGVKDSTKQASPSKEAYDAGVNIGKGAIDGIKSQTDEAQVASTELAKSVVKPITQASKSGSSFGNVNAKEPTPAAPFVRTAPVAGPVAAGVSPVQEELVRTKTLLGDLKGSFASFRENLSREMGWVKEEFRSVGSDMKGMFGKASQETKDVVSKTAAIRAAENNQILVNGKKAGFNYVAAMAGRDGAVEAIVTKKNAEIISKVSANWNAGLREIPPIVPRELSKAQQEFLKIGQNLKTQMVDQEIQRANALRGAQAGANAAGGTGLTPVAPGEKGFIGPLTEEMSMTLGQKVEGFANSLSKGSLAVAGVAGTMTMFGGEIGHIAGMVLQVSLAFSALASVTAALTKAKVLEKATSIATGIGGMAKAGTLAKGGVMNNIINVITSVVGPIGKIGKMFLRMIPWVGGLLLAFELFKFVANEMEEQKKKITGLGDTAFLAAEKMQKAGELLGFTPTGGIDLSAGITNVKGVGSAELSQAQQIQQGETFKTDWADEIKAIGGASLAEAESALNSMIIQLIASGSSPEAAQALATAIATEAGKTDVDLSYGVKFDPTDAASLQSITTAAKANAASYKDVFEANYVQPQIVQTNIGPQQIGGRITDEMRTAAATLGGEVSTAITALKAGLDQGTLSATEFQSQISAITGDLSSLDPKALGLVLPTIAKNLGVEEQLKGLDDLESQLVVIEALLVGVEVPQETIDRMKELSKSSDPDDQAELLKIQQDLVKSTNDEVSALESRADAKQADIQADIEAAEYREGLDSLDARIQALQNEATAYGILTQNGFTAAEATAAVADANFAAALAAAANSEEQAVLMDRYREMMALAAASPTATSRGGGGAAKKSEFQEAVEGLQKQRDEIKNNIAAYNKLRNAGMGVKAAFEAASDPQIAAALARTKPGTAQWEKLIKLIKQTNAATKELEQLELNIKVQTDFDGFLDDMISKANEYYDILEKNIEIAYRDRIKKEEDAIEKAEKDISKLQEDVAKKERTIELTYDRPIAVLQEESSDLSNDLTIMDQKAKAINEKYDAQAKALEEVKQINQDIINQQKSQISLADALSQGDISAAAGLMQDMRAQSAAAASGSIGNALEAARQGELGGLRNAAGQTREQIEQRQYEIGQLIYALEEKKEVVLGEIRDLQDKIYNIEVGSLKTARDKLQALEDEKQAQIDVLDAQRQKWDDAKNAANNARIKAGEFNDVLNLGKLLVGDIKSKWDDIKSKMITLTIREVRETSGGGSSSSGGGGGGGSSTRSTTTTNNQGSQTGPSAAEKQAAAAALAAGRPLTEAQRAIVGLPASDSARQAAVAALTAGRPLTAAQKKILNMKYGGVVKKMANGGIVGGTGMGDVVPAMLTPGEFVVNKASSKQFMPMLKSMNDGKFPASMKNRMAPAPMSPPSVNFRVNTSSKPLPMPTAPAQNWNRLSAPATVSAPSTPRATSVPSGSGAGSISSTDASNTVYNYNLSVSVKGGSNANPDAIANTVIAKIKQMDSQRIRGKVIS